MNRLWITRLVILSALIILLDLWLVCDIQQAGNVVVFYLWLLSLVQLVGALVIAAEKDKPRTAPESRPFRTLHRTLHDGIALLLVWNGYVILPIALIVTTFLCSAAIDQRATPAPEAKS